MVHKESETIEFKKLTAELKDAVVAIAAMLNKHGQGEVYFGKEVIDTVTGCHFSEIYRKSKGIL